MNDQTELSALQRKAGTGRTPSEGAGMTPAKAFRLALSKAAQVELGLAMRVQSIKEEKLNQAQLLDVLDQDALLLMLEGVHGGKGVAVIDMQVLAALIEVQTLGQVSQAKAALRAPTRTDSAMCETVLDRTLREFEAHLAGSTAADWATGFRFEKQIASVRLMGLALEDVAYRVFHLPLDLADGAKQGTLLIALPAQGMARGHSEVQGDDGWAQAMENAVRASHVDILAVLHRAQMPLAAVQAFKPGDLVPVPKSAISEVSMVGGDGRVVGAARLGQQQGFRALRLSGGSILPPAVDAQMMALPETAVAMDDPPAIDIPVGDAAGGLSVDDIPMMPMDNPLPDIADNIPMAAMPMNIGID